MKTKYYYDPVTWEFYKDPYAAVQYQFHHLGYHAATRQYLEYWTRLNSKEWVRSHSDVVCEIMGFYQTYTRWDIELRIRNWFHRLLNKKCSLH